MSWVVVSEASFDAWVARTHPQHDQDLRIAVLQWVIGLVDGPPRDGILDPWARVWFAQVGDTDPISRASGPRRTDRPQVPRGESGPPEEGWFLRAVCGE